MELNFTHLQQREQHWAIVDPIGKVGHMRTVPMPDWVKAVVDIWLNDAGIASAGCFVVNRARRVWGDGMTEKVGESVLGQVSIQTTERYLGCKQRIRSAVNDRIGIEPKSGQTRSSSGKPHGPGRLWP